MTPRKESDNFWESSLSFQPALNLLRSIKRTSILVKVGGNALTDLNVKKDIMKQVARIKKWGGNPVVVHGGGPVIQHLLEDVGIRSEFIGGHRKTDARSMAYVEMALSGHVNAELVKCLNRAGAKAVGISGKDAAMVKAQKRFYTENENGVEKKIDLGHVGDVCSVDVSLIHTLIRADIIPVVSPVSMSDDGDDYNINADMFAGHLAGALKTDHFVTLTNVDGLMRDIDDPGSIIHKISPEEIRSLFGTVIQEGMIPKIEACLIALEQGVKSVHIINGTQKDNLLRILLTEKPVGTVISRQ